MQFYLSGLPLKTTCHHSSLTLLPQMVKWAQLINLLINCNCGGASYVTNAGFASRNECEHMFTSAESSDMSYINRSPSRPNGSSTQIDFKRSHIFFAPAQESDWISFGVFCIDNHKSIRMGEEHKCRSGYKLSPGRDIGRRYCPTTQSHRNIKIIFSWAFPPHKIDKLLISKTETPTTAQTIRSPIN